jgi:hypothetical protein
MATPDVSRVNSEVIVLNEFYSTAQLKLFKIVLETAATADTQAGGAGTAITEGTARNILDALNPMMAEFAADGEELVVVMDGHANDITSIATRLGHLIEATGLIEGAGVWKDGPSGNAVVTVTEPESFATLVA